VCRQVRPTATKKPPWPPLERLTKFAGPASPRMITTERISLVGRPALAGASSERQNDKPCGDVGRHQRSDGVCRCVRSARRNRGGTGFQPRKLKGRPTRRPPARPHDRPGASSSCARTASPSTNETHRKASPAQGPNQRAPGRWWTLSLNTDYWQYSHLSRQRQCVLALAWAARCSRDLDPGRTPSNSS